MKKDYLIVIALLIFTSSCEMEIQPPPPPASVVEAALTMTQAASETETFADKTPIINTTFTPEIIDPTSPEDIFRDDFNGVLASDWQWSNEDRKSWSITDMPGTLQIQSQFGYIVSGSANNLLLRNAPNGDFTAETSLNFSPDENDQFGGIVLFESEKNFFQAGLGYCALAVGCIERGFYLDVYKDGKLAIPRHGFRFTSDIISIRLVIQGNELSVLLSPDGKVWYRTFQEPLDITPVKIGLFTGQNSDLVIIPATFEYFEVITLKK